jgi:hypothetical protein
MVKKLNYCWAVIRNKKTRVQTHDSANFQRTRIDNYSDTQILKKLKPNGSLKIQITT